MSEVKMKMMDGNEAAASVAHRMNVSISTGVNVMVLTPYYGYHSFTFMQPHMHVLSQ